MEISTAGVLPRKNDVIYLRGGRNEAIQLTHLCGEKSRIPIAYAMSSLEFRLNALSWFLVLCTSGKQCCNMCYIIITGGSLVWFILSLIADMLIVLAIVTPKWLIGPSPASAIAARFVPPTQQINELAVPNATNSVSAAVTVRYPSVGIYTRCIVMHSVGYHCGPFDLDGFATDSAVYPAAWKAAMFFISLGFAVHSITVALTLVTCCKQSAFGKSIHNMTGCAQVVSGISVMLCLFLHPLGWGVPRVQQLCGADAEPFYPAACTIGASFYSAVAAVLLCFLCAGISFKAESSNMRSRVKRYIEEGNRLVCIP